MCASTRADPEARAPRARARGVGDDGHRPTRPSPSHHRTRARTREALPTKLFSAHAPSPDASQPSTSQPNTPAGGVAYKRRPEHPRPRPITPRTCIMLTCIVLSISVFTCYGPCSGVCRPRVSARTCPPKEAHGGPIGWKKAQGRHQGRDMATERGNGAPYHGRARGWGGVGLPLPPGAGPLSVGTLPPRWFWVGAC